MKWILSIIAKVFGFFTSTPSQPTMPTPQPPSTNPTPSNYPTPTVPIGPTPASPDTLYADWSVQKKAYHNVRVLCDLAGLDVADKNIICACIYQESQFLNTARHANRNSAGVVVSTDYGICQINDHYHIGPGKDFPSVAYVLQNPQKMVEYMILMKKQGLLHLWSSYASGAYQVWLSPGSPMWTLAM